MVNPAASKGLPVLPAYIEIKRAVIAAGLLSCSQAGFNIMLGPLAGLFEALKRHLCRLDPQASLWIVPPLLRPDWLPQGPLPPPGREQWCHEKPGGFLLTPRPLMHLLGRMRWHPEESGGWVLSGQCARQETDTLPLRRQRVFSVAEYVWLGDEEWTYARLAATAERLLRLCQDWRLPVEMKAEDDDQSILLALPDTEPLKLMHATRISPAELSSYGIEERAVLTLSCGIERFMLAFLAAQGIEPRKWQV